MGYIAENQLHELNRSVVPQVYSVYVRDYIGRSHKQHSPDHQFMLSSTNFCIFCLEFLSQLFQHHRSVILGYVLSLFTNDIWPAVASYAWHWRGWSTGSRGWESPSGVQGHSPGRGSGGRSPPEAAASLYIQGQKYSVLRHKVCSRNLCVVGFHEIAACSRIFGQNTKFLNTVNNNWWKSFSVGTLDMQFQVF